MIHRLPVSGRYSTSGSGCLCPTPRVRKFDARRAVVGAAFTLGLFGACTTDDRCSTEGADLATAINVAVAMDRARVAEPRVGFLEAWLREHGSEPLGSSSTSWVIAVGTDPKILEDQAVQALPGFQTACSAVLAREAGSRSP